MKTYDNEFCVIDTPEKAYVLGLIFSDGSIGNYGNSYVVSLSQHENEEYLLDRIVELFPFFIKKVSTDTPQVRVLTCCQKAFVEDLYNHGVVSQKSNENRFKLRFPQLPKELESHFIRGYFDGDGRVYKQKLGNTKFEIGGTCYYMITDLIKVLYDNGIDVNLRCRHAGTGLRTIDFYVLYSSSDKISKQFAKYIYNNCGNLYIKRKYDKLNYSPDYHKPESPTCPICGNSNTLRMGYRQMKTRLVLRAKCKDCNKQFSITAPVSSNINSGEDELLED